VAILDFEAMMVSKLYINIPSGFIIRHASL